MFITALYGQKDAQTMTEERRPWKEKTGRANITSSPKLASLPPTTEAFTLNVLRARLQTCIWKNATQSNPPPLDPATYGWIKDIANKSLQPAVLPPNAPAPSFILKLIKYSCMYLYVAYVQISEMFLCICRITLYNILSL